MKKISLLFMFAGCLSFQAFSQATLNRGGAAAAKTSDGPMSIVHTKNGFNQVPVATPKWGSNPSVNVAYSDDFSQLNDTTSLKARGYLPYYRGTGPQGVTATWFDGNTAVFTDFNNGSAEYVASNYQSVTLTNNIDNWLVLPALDVAAGDVISFYSRAPLNSTYPDSIRVMYSAVGDSTPEDLSWVELGRFEVNITGAWLQESFSAPAAGTTARFAIRYCVVDGGPNGLNSDYIGIDQLEVFTPSALDLEATTIAALNVEYSRIPLSQVPSGTLTGSVKNNGINATSGGTALIEVIDTVSTSVVFTETVNLPNINPGATVAVTTTNSFTPSAAGFLRTRITVSIPGDGNTANDIANSAPTEVTDSVYARDRNESTGSSLGIGAGPAAGIIGQNFQVTTQDHATSVSFFMLDTFDPNPAGTPVYATIHPQPIGGTPDDVPIATTTTMMFTPGQIAVGGEWFTLPIDGPSIQLAPGLYYVGLHEVDSLLTLGTTTEILTPATVWVTWNTIPSPPAVNGWAMAQDFNFNIQYNLRLNFGTPVLGINDVEHNSTLISVYPSPATSELNITLAPEVRDAKIEVYNSLSALVKTMNNVNGNTRMDVSTLAKGIYTLKVTSNGKDYTQRFTVTH